MAHAKRGHTLKELNRGEIRRLCNPMDQRYRKIGGLQNVMWSKTRSDKISLWDLTFYIVQYPFISHKISKIQPARRGHHQKYIISDQSLRKSKRQANCAVKKLAFDLIKNLRKSVAFWKKVSNMVQMAITKMNLRGLFYLTKTPPIKQGLRTILNRDMECLKRPMEALSCLWSDVGLGKNWGRSPCDFKAVANAEP